MRQGNLTREQIESKYGVDIVNKLDRECCEHTGVIQTDGDEAVEFSASIISGDDVIIAYYYMDQDSLDAHADDLGGCDWEINGYEIV